MKKKTIAALVVLALAISGVAVSAAQTDNTPLYDEIDARGELIIAQENLLNTYRCLFDVDTQIVPEGCTNGVPNKNLVYEPYARSGQTPGDTPTPAPTATPAAQTVTSHWHCERIINDGSRCDRRFSPGRCWHSHPVDESHRWNSDTLSC